MSASPTILGALVARFDAGITTASGGLWVGQVPEGKTDQNLPFYALIHEGEVPNFTFETGYWEDVRFYFEVYEVGLAAVEALAQAVKNLFDFRGRNEANAALPITNANLQGFQRLNYKVEVVGERTSTGDQVFKARIWYGASVNKTLP